MIIPTSRLLIWSAGMVIALLIIGWLATSLLYRQSLRSGEVVQATNAINTAAFDSSQSMRSALEGSLVAQRIIESANSIQVRELARLEKLHWDQPQLNLMRSQQAEAREIEQALADPTISTTRRDFLIDRLSVNLERLTSTTSFARILALQDSAREMRTLYFIQSAAFAAALLAVIVTLISYAQQQREHDRYERSLQHANEQLRVHANEMEQIVYVASHDLKEPLRMVHAYADLLKRNIGPALTEQNRVYLDYVRKGAKRMNLLVDDLLRLAILDQGTLPAQTVEAATEVAEITELFRDKLNEVGGTLTVGPLPHLRVDRSRFSRLMQNLIDNAIKYRDPSRPLRIRVDAQAKGSQWQFVVEDNGIGVPAEHREQIFKLFQRLHGPEIDGSGAGLAICMKIVHGWGGRIWAESAGEQGSRFCFTTPSDLVVPISDRSRSI